MHGSIDQKHPVMCMAELINDSYCNAVNRFIRLPKSNKSKEKVQMIILNPAKVDGIRVSKFVNLVAFQFSKFYLASVERHLLEMD